VRLSSETESVATRSHDPGEEIDLTEEHTLKPYPIRDSGVLPSPCHERDLQRGAGEGAQPKPPAISLCCRKEELARRPGIARSLRSGRGTRRRPFASVIAATPRALSHTLRQPRRTRAGALLSGRRREPPVERILAGHTASSVNDERLGARFLPEERTSDLRRRRPRCAPLPIHAFGAEG
jgi:hypothetical protein